MTKPSGYTLARFAAESNAIEGIYAMPGEPLYDDHLLMAGQVKALAIGGMLALPREIHDTIMRSEPDTTPGVYRKVDVSVGGQRKMPWRDVPEAMESLLERAAMLPDSIGGGDGDSGDAECWYFHNEFEHIHPFRDGNGRTGRLWMNALRLACGLPWLTVKASERRAYYARIRSWEAKHD